jgi:hypothetical protein
VVHQLFEDLDADTGVGVALGVGVAERVRVDQRPVERQRGAVGAGKITV